MSSSVLCCVYSSFSLLPSLSPLLILLLILLSLSLSVLLYFAKKKEERRRQKEKKTHTLIIFPWMAKGYGEGIWM